MPVQAGHVFFNKCICCVCVFFNANMLEKLLLQVIGQKFIYLLNIWQKTEGDFYDINLGTSKTSILSRSIFGG